ncbi:MAG: ribosome assembly RNA-binding protein YhbY [Erysipelotrichaceae bacterium]|nr:ribosome assembly RNA-binding protein YhbY [Erysipelotrichaceae bacterium]
MLTKTQKQFLKGLANPLKAMVTIGKTGLTENIINSIEEQLTAHELVKVSVLNTCDQPISEMAIEIAAETSSEIISQLGHKIVFYRRNLRDSKIVLPK